jgi:hypothetical protein
METVFAEGEKEQSEWAFTPSANFSLVRRSLSQCTAARRLVRKLHLPKAKKN